MLPPLHPVLARSPEFLTLPLEAQYAFVTLWKPHEERVIDILDDCDHLDMLAMLLAPRLSLGRDPRAAMIRIWSEWRRRGVAVLEPDADGQADRRIVLPLLSSDRLKRVHAAHGGVAASTTRADENRRTAVAHRVRRQREKGDLRSVDELKALYLAEYDQRRAQHETVPEVSRPTSRPPARDEATTPADVTVRDIPGRASPSLSSSISISDRQEREHPEIPDARDSSKTAIVTSHAVTSPVTTRVVTPAGVQHEGTLPLDTESDDQIADVALEAFALGGSKFAGGNELQEQRVALANLIRQLKLTRNDLRLAGQYLATIDVPSAFSYAKTVVLLGVVDVGFLLGRRYGRGHEGRPLMTLVAGGRQRDRQTKANASRSPEKISPTVPPIEGRSGAALLRGTRESWGAR